MKTKFIIAKAGANSYWQYYKPCSSKDVIYESHQPKTYIVNEVVDSFLCTGITEAYQFDSYEQAEERIKWFNELKNETKQGDKVTFTYPGVGIYKIEKIFVIELP